MPMNGVVSLRIILSPSSRSKEKCRLEFVTFEVIVLKKHQEDPLSSEFPVILLSGKYLM